MEVTDNTERPLPLKEEFINNISREKKACHAMQGHVRKDQGWSGGSRGEKGLSWGFHGKQWARQAKYPV